jgi:cytochrome c peroxidase
MKVYGRKAVLPVVGGVAVYAMVLALTAGLPSASGGSGSGGSGSGGSGSGGSGGGGNAGGFNLKGHPVPDPTTLGDYIVDRAAAVQLGKALFWDAQAGSDGVQACASCHFNSGADNRANNSLNPGHNGIFNQTDNGATGPNAATTAGDYPFHRLSNPDSRSSLVMYDSDDIHGSQGVFLRTFGSVGSTAVDSCTDNADATFNVGGTNVRRVTGMNTPTAINSAYNFRNFWDGRAREQFNGNNPGGSSDPNARIYRAQADGSLMPVAVLIDHGAAASQSTGPAMSGTEMSCGGRIWPNLGRKLMGLNALAEQMVSSTDSVLGGIANPNGTGLTVSYDYLVTKAFKSDLWNGTGSVSIGGAAFTQKEANFSLFWGLALQMYESTLVSDDAPIDRFAAGDASALTAQQQLGLSVFQGNGRCINCHAGPLFTKAAGTVADDKMFLNTGVRPVVEAGGDVLNPGLGRFKVSGLRNVEFTGPYFHNGGQATLRQVVDFYNRGGDFPSANTDSQIRPLGLTSTQKDALVSFLLALSDNRVKWSMAPFDHPGLCVPNGEKVNSGTPTDDMVSCISAVGAGGSTTPLTTFLGLDPHQP